MLETYNDIMTVEDVCESLLIGKNAAYQLLNQGSIKAFRMRPLKILCNRQSSTV